MADINQPYQNPQNFYENYLNSCFNLCISALKNLSKIMTFFIGIYLYILSFIDFYNSIIGVDILYKNSVYASLFTLFCPLWTQSFSDISYDLKDCYRIKSILILLLSFILLIISIKKEVKKYVPLIFDFTLIFSGIFLALSYFQSGKKFIQNCEKSCEECSSGCDVLFCCCEIISEVDCENCDCIIM